MNSKMTKLVLSVCAAASLLSACSMSIVGSKEGDVPPRVIADPKNPSSRVWDNPGAFGPVPADKAEFAKQACATMSTKDVEIVPLGYHSKAQGYDGKTLPYGGVYCVRK